MHAARNQTLDIAKGVGIILVVLGHNWVTLHERGDLYRIIFSFHVPLFFYLSGVFLRPSEKWSTFVFSRLDSLLKPYFTVLAVVGIAKLIYWHFLGAGKGFEILKYFSFIVYGTGKSLFLSDWTVVWVALWFLPSLFLSLLFALMLIKIAKHRSLIFILAVASLSIGAKLLPGHNWVWSLDLVPVTAAFAAMGYLSRGALETFQLRYVPLLIAVLSFFALHYLFNETIDLNMRVYGNFFICTAQAFLGIYICLCAASVLTEFRYSRLIFSYIGAGSLFILLFHWVFQAYAFDASMRATGSLVLSCSVGFVAGILLPLAFLEVAKRNYLFSLLLLHKNFGYRFKNLETISKA